MNYEITDLRFVVSTNENNFHLAELAAHYLWKHSRCTDLKLSIVSNRISDDINKQTSIHYFDAGVEYQPSAMHFGDSMLKFLKSIDEPYILFMCDDYMMIRDIRWQQMKDVMHLVRMEDMDYYGFDDVMGKFLGEFPIFDKEYPGIEKGSLRYRWHDYQYIYSVQPCIWKRDTLIAVIEQHLPMSAHCLDNTRTDIRENTRGKITGLYNILPSCFTDTELYYDPPWDRPDIPHYDYFAMAYVEVVRHGVFMVPENGWGIREQRRTKVIEEMIRDFNLLDNIKFKRLLQNRGVNAS